MRASRLLLLVPSLVMAAQVIGAENGSQLISRVIPSYGVRQDVPFRQPSRIEAEITRAHTFIAEINARMLTHGVPVAEIASIDEWQNRLDKLAKELVPAASIYELQQLDSVTADLVRASETILLLSNQAPPLEMQTAVAVPVAPPVRKKPAIVEAPAVAPELEAAPAPAPEALAPEVPAPAPEAPAAAPMPEVAPAPEAPALEVAPVPEVLPTAPTP